MNQLIEEYCTCEQTSLSISGKICEYCQKPTQPAFLGISVEEKIETQEKQG
jgi:hypothetical protein